jgi:hypothetical protein
MTDAEFSQKLEALAREARPLDDDEWGSERQTQAQDAFFNFVKAHMHPRAYEDLEMWCLKATTDEMIDEATRRLREG